jgi:ankyrin repeat protein
MPTDYFALMETTLNDKKKIKHIKDLLKTELKNKSIDLTLTNTNDRNTLLHQAAKFCPDLISGLVKFIDVNVKNKNGVTPLHIAAKYSKDAIKKLAKVDSLDTFVKDCDGNTALHYAAKYNQDVVRTLIKIGVDANEKNNKGLTALDIIEQLATSS